MKLDIFKKTKHIDPNYEHLTYYIDIMWKSFWTPTKYKKNIEKQDAPYVLNSMGAVDATVIKRSVLGISLVEDKVKTFWSVLHNDIPQTVVGEVGSVFGNSEVVHAQSYRALADSLKLERDFEKILENPVMKGRVDYLQKYLEKTPDMTGKRLVLKKLILFTALVERASLFSQFYILMSYANANKGLKTISSLQSSTSSEELIHYAFGIELINIIKTENPTFWDDILIDKIEKDIIAAHQAELNLLDWIFETGVPGHITIEEVKNFLNYNFNTICGDLKLNLVFPFDRNLYEDRNSWMLNSLKPSESDFFANPHGGYSSVEEEISDLDLEDIFK